MDVSDKTRHQLAFFGLTPETAAETKLAIYTQIHEIVFHGKGGYDWQTIYNMPIWLRRFTFNQLQKFYSEESDRANTQTQGNKTTVIDSDGTIKAPEHLKQHMAKRTSYQ